MNNGLKSLLKRAMRKRRQAWKYGGTYFHELGYINGRRFAFVASWQDYKDGAGEKLYAKVASQPVRSIRQCDYDFDWEMPFNEETGEVDDNEVEIGDCMSDITDAQVAWFSLTWNRIKKEILGVTRKEAA